VNVVSHEQYIFSEYLLMYVLSQSKWM